MTILEVPTQRETCCHAGGDMLFDEDGNLILATGDNTNPFQSNGFTPIDEQAGRKNFDAQRTSGNTNDLRGKVLRITPLEEGGYTIPEGNLFAPETALTKPEIYAMGFRNPFRIDLDHESGNILVADYGPDNRNGAANRGPAGTVEWNVVAEPGNYGWPYCTGPNDAYNDYDFATGQSGEKFDCENGPLNDSPNNTGLEQLPPAIEAEIYYTSNNSPVAPAIGGGGAPMAGPTYSYDPELDSDVKWPEYWDGKALMAEWNHGTMFSVQLGQEDREEVLQVNRVLPGILDPEHGFNRAMDFSFGPDGALYVIDWGAGFGGNNATSEVFKINYVKGNPAPLARAEADVTSGPAPLTVQFSSEGTRHPAGDPISLQWTFGDGSEPTDDPNPTHTYTEEGVYTAQLVVTDDDGDTGVANLTIVVGNEAPTISITFPENGGFFDFGDQVAYEIAVDDPDGEVDCSDVQLFTSLGHDSHAHPFEELFGCSGMLQTARDEGHGISENIFWVVEATYTDDGGSVGSPLSANDLQVLQPKTLQAEFFTSTGRLEGSESTGTPGVQTEPTEDEAGGGLNIGWTEADDWWAFEPISLTNVDGIALRVSAPKAGTVSVRWDDPEGPELASIPVPNTGGWQNWVTTDVVPLSENPGGSGTLYFVSSGSTNVNWAEFDGRGVTENERPEVDLTVAQTELTAPGTVNASVSATDPDGEVSDLTYAWDAGLGDGFQEGGETFSFTYDEPGEYRLQVRVTDGGGAYTDVYQTITVTTETAVLPMCFDGRSDDFLGDELDEDRWTDVVRRDQNLRVEDSALIIPTSKADIHAGNTGVTNIVLQELPEGDFTVTTKVDIDAVERWQQAGIVLYEDDDNYAKLMVAGRTVTPDSSQRVVQLLTEKDGSPSETNTPALGQGVPTTLYLRLTNAGGTLTGAWSTDGAAFTTLPETRSLDGLENLRVGLAAWANDTLPTEPIDARFDWFHITPDDTAGAAGPDDEFDGAEINTCQWSIVRPDAEGLRLADGWLEIDTSPYDIAQGNNTPVSNIVLQDQPGEDWTIETLVDGSEFDQGYEQGGLIVYVDDDTYLKLDYISDSATSSRLEFRGESGGSLLNPRPQLAGVTEDVWHLRIAKEGTAYTASYSTDGETWESFAPITHTGLGEAKVGLFALGARDGADATARFDYFRVVEDGEPLTVSATLNPAEPNGPDGSYIGAVEVSVETAGGPAGELVYREVNVDGEGWQEYTSPISIDEVGEHTVAFRASAGAENVDGETVTFTIVEATVASAPQVSVVQARCTYQGLTISQVPGSITGVEGEGIAEYVVTAEGMSDIDPMALEPGTYTVTATPAAGYVLEAAGAWTAAAGGALEREVVIDAYPCQIAAPALTVTHACGEVGGSIVGDDVEGVDRYEVRSGSRVVDGGDLAVGTYTVRAYPSAGTVLTIPEGWSPIFRGGIQRSVTIEEVTCD